MAPASWPLLKDPRADWSHISLTHAAKPGSFGLSAEGWRYIHYNNGGEELYDIIADPHEWTNLANRPDHNGKLEELRARAPKQFAPLLAPTDDSLPILTWHAGPASASKPGGSPFDVVFINNQPVPVELFWMDRQGTPKSYGFIDAGNKKRQQTRPGAVWQITVPETSAPIGHFIVDDRPARAEIPAPLNKHLVTQPPKALDLNPFYHKYLNVGGYPVVSSEKVSDFALLEAAYLIKTMLAKRPDILKALGETGSRMTVMAHTEFTTDVPEHSRLGTGNGGKSSDWWDRRARGLGGSATDPVASCGQENLLCFPGDPYFKENILIHEFAHTIHLRGVNHLDPSFDDRVKAAYEKAVAAGLWKTKYAGTNHHEYFAEGVQSWFNNNREHDHDHNHVNTRAELIAYEPGLAAVVKEVFHDTKFEYVRPPDRKQQGHLDGYDYSKSPEFQWPNRLQAIDPKQ